RDTSLMRFVPRSLPGQIALLVAVALFVAQAINFTLLLRERQDARFSQATAPSVTRLIDASDRIATGHFKSDARTRVELFDHNPIDPRLPPRHDVEEGIRSGLRDANIDVGQIITGVRPFAPNDPMLRRMDRVRAERVRRLGAELQIAVEQPGGHG